MKRFVIICCALLSCAFTIVTPEMIEERERLCDRIRSHYGEDGLTAFVKDVIGKYPEVGGARLADSKVGVTWETMSWNPFWHIISEDWAMVVKDDKEGSVGFDSFTMFWMCDDDHGVFVEGHRDKEGELILDSIRREETVELNWM